MEDVLIIGAGIFGLTLARKLKKAGRDVRVVDAVGIGGGASATPLGVLAPHAPDRWNAKKEAQFEALTSLPDYLAELEDETGIDTGYRRCGRLIPLRTENLATIWHARVEDARQNWRGAAEIEIVEADPDWLSPDAAKFGAARCGLTARIDAPAYLRALACSIGEDRIEGGYRLKALEDEAALFDNGERVAARLIVLATGAAAFEFLPDHDDEPAGRGEWGSLALFELDPKADTRPILFERGCYVVPRAAGEIAVGVTSSKAPIDDEVLDRRIGEARDLCPALSDAKERTRWQAIRPRAANKLIVNAPHPSRPNIWVATGGFKTGLAMAHQLDAPSHLGFG